MNPRQTSSAFNSGGITAGLNAQQINFSDGTTQTSAAKAAQQFFVDYTFTDADQSNGYAFVPCLLPVPYDDADYFIQCTLQNLSTLGGYLVLGYIGGDGVAHGAAPTPTGFNVVLLAVGNSGIVAGQSVKIHCETTKN